MCAHCLLHLCLEPSPALGQSPEMECVRWPHGAPWQPPPVPGLEAAPSYGSRRELLQKVASERTSRVLRSQVPSAQLGLGKVVPQRGTWRLWVLQCGAWSHGEQGE